MVSAFKLKYLTYRYRKLLVTFGIITALVILYNIYRLDIYVWLCENEDSSAACAVSGMIHLEKGEDSIGRKFLERSCNMKYGSGCYRLYQIQDKEGEREAAKQSLARACSLGIKAACEE